MMESPSRLASSTCNVGTEVFMPKQSIAVEALPGDMLKSVSKPACPCRFSDFISFSIAFSCEMNVWPEFSLNRLKIAVIAAFLKS